MRIKLLLILTVLISLASFGQEISPNIRVKLQTESKEKTYSSYCNYYILDSRDTFYFPDNSTVIQCNFLQKLDKDHNKCLIYINQKPGNGSIEIVRNDYPDKSTSVFCGTISNGLILNGTFMIKSFNGLPLLTGQYYNNWKHGYWTSYYPNGRIETIDKYIEGANEPVKTWEFNELGELKDYTDEEAEVINLIKKEGR